MILRLTAIRRLARASVAWWRQLPLPPTLAPIAWDQARQMRYLFARIHAGVREIPSNEKKSAVRLSPKGGTDAGFFAQGSRGFAYRSHYNYYFAFCCS